MTLLSARMKLICLYGPAAGYHRRAAVKADRGRRVNRSPNTERDGGISLTTKCVRQRAAAAAAAARSCIRITELLDATISTECQEEQQLTVCVCVCVSAQLGMCAA